MILAEGISFLGQMKTFVEDELQNVLYPLDKVGTRGFLVNKKKKLDTTLVHAKHRCPMLEAYGDGQKQEAILVLQTSI